jgi:hypothetical protein
MFYDKAVGTFTEMGKIKCRCKFLTLKHEENYLFKNTLIFQGLGLVGTHITHGSNIFHSGIIIGIKNLHKEINKHLTLGSSVNQILSYRLPPFLMETMKHEDQGMIYNILFLPCH